MRIKKLMLFSLQSKSKQRTKIYIPFAWEAVSQGGNGSEAHFFARKFYFLGHKETGHLSNKMKKNWSVQTK